MLWSQTQLNKVVKCSVQCSVHLQRTAVVAQVDIVHWFLTSLQVTTIPNVMEVLRTPSTPPHPPPLPHYLKSCPVK